MNLSLFIIHASIYTVKTSVLTNIKMYLNGISKTAAFVECIANPKNG